MTTFLVFTGFWVFLGSILWSVFIGQSKQVTIIAQIAFTMFVMGVFLTFLVG